MLSHFQTEKHIQEYNKMARKLKLIPSTAEHANGIDFEMHFNPHTQRPDQRTHVDFKGTIKVLSVLTEIESCPLIRFFFLSLLLGSRNARIPVVSCTSSSLILFVQGHCLNVLFLIKRFNYKMADLGQVSSLYSFLPSLGPGTVMGENGKKSRCKSKTKGEWTDPRGVMSPFLSQTPSCLFSRHCQAWSLATSCPARKLIFPERSRLDSSPVRVFFGTRECLKLIPRQIKSIRVLWNFS